MTVTFLNKVCTQIADIDYGKIQLYAGNYDFWYESSQLLIKQMKEANKKKEEKIKELQEFISTIQCQRFQVQAGNLQKDVPLRRSSWMTCVLPAVNIPTLTSVQTVKLEMKFLLVENLSKTIDGVKVLDNISFTLGREDKVAFVGANEHGKNYFLQDPHWRNGTG